MSKTKELEDGIERYEIESKKEWRALSANNLYDMYMDKKKGSNEFSLHAKGTMKMKTPPPPVEPPGDIQGTLNLILAKLNQHDQRFDAIDQRIKENSVEIKSINKRIDNLESSVNKRFDEVKSEIKNVNVRVDEVKTEVNEVKNDIKNVNARVDEVKVEVKNTNERIDEVKSEVKNTNKRIDNLESNVNRGFDDINTRIDTIVKLNHLEAGDDHK